MKGNFNVEIGALPTLIGDEYTFTFENMNIERGLLWNQEPAVSRGIQLNDTYKKLTLSFSWNDGFYSNRYTSLVGLAGLCHQWLKYVHVCGRRECRVVREDRSQLLPDACLSKQRAGLQPDLHLHERAVTISPYYQYTVVKSNNALYGTGAHTNGGALLGQLQLQARIFAFRPAGIHQVERKRSHQRSQLAGIRSRNRRVLIHRDPDLGQGCLLPSRRLSRSFTSRTSSLARMLDSESAAATPTRHAA